MSTNSPRHSENVTNFGVLYSKTTTYGSKYNPSNELYAPSNLQKIKADGESALNQVNFAEVNYKSAISAQTESFEGFDQYITRVANTLNICGASSQIIEQGQSIIRQLRGKRVSELLSNDELALAKEKGDESKQNTIHNSTINIKIENFGKLYTFLGNIPQYNPNEADLSINAMEEKLSGLKSKHEVVTNAKIALEVARNNRDKILYKLDTGLVDIALSVKQYIKAAFGASSTEFKQISAIHFSKLN